AVARREPRPPSARASDAPLRFFGSQWSPTFSCVRSRAAYATRWARSASSYSSAAASCALANVRFAFAPERRSVAGSSESLAAPERVVFGIVRLLRGPRAAGEGTGPALRGPRQPAPSADAAHPEATLSGRRTPSATAPAARSRPAPSPAGGASRTP